MLGKAEDCACRRRLAASMRATLPRRMAWILDAAAVLSSPPVSPIAFDFATRRATLPRGAANRLVTQAPRTPIGNYAVLLRAIIFGVVYRVVPFWA